MIDDRLDQLWCDGVGAQVGRDADDLILRGAATGPARRNAMQPAPDGIGAAKQLIHERAIDDDALRRADAVAVAQRPAGDHLCSERVEEIRGDVVEAHIEST